MTSPKEGLASVALFSKLTLEKNKPKFVKLRFFMENSERITPQKESEWDPEIRGLFERMGYKSEDDLYNILKTLAHHPKMFKRWLPFANHVLFKSTLSPRIREIIILRTGWLCCSEYEWTQHVRIGREEAGMKDVDFKALETGASDPHWNGEESVVLRAVEELIPNKCISDEVWKEMSKHFDHMQIIDIVAAVGNYTLVSMMLNTFNVKLDGWLERYEGFSRNSM